jgi:hypothetical protein
LKPTLNELGKLKDKHIENKKYFDKLKKRRLKKFELRDARFA